MQIKTHIRKGDTVLVITGEDSGRQGRVLAVDRKNGAAIVEGLRLNKRHSKPSTDTPQGGILDRESPIHLSNLMLVDPKSGKPGRAARRKDKDGKWERYVKVKESKTGTK